MAYQVAVKELVTATVETVYEVEAHSDEEAIAMAKAGNFRLRLDEIITQVHTREAITVTGEAVRVS